MKLTQKQIADRLKAIRKKSGLKQYEVASIINVARPTYSRYEAGTLGINSENLQALAKTYNIPVSYFYGDDTALTMLDVRKAIENANATLSQVAESKTMLERYIELHTSSETPPTVVIDVPEPRQDDPNDQIELTDEEFNAILSLEQVKAELQKLGVRFTEAPDGSINIAPTDIPEDL